MLERIITNGFSFDEIFYIHFSHREKFLTQIFNVNNKKEKGEGIKLLNIILKNKIFFVDEYWSMSKIKENKKYTERRTPIVMLYINF